MDKGIPGEGLCPTRSLGSGHALDGVGAAGRPGRRCAGCWPVGPGGRPGGRRRAGAGPVDGRPAGLGGPARAGRRRQGGPDPGLGAVPGDAGRAQQAALAAVADATEGRGLAEEEARHEVGAALRLSPSTAGERTWVAVSAAAPAAGRAGRAAGRGHRLPAGRAPGRRGPRAARRRRPPRWRPGCWPGPGPDAGRVQAGGGPGGAGRRPGLGRGPAQKAAAARRIERGAAAGRHASAAG